MSARLATLVDLLHRVPRAALATHSARLPGFPFASAVAFAPDERHRPVMLMSQLAEHSRNLQQDARASLMVVDPVGPGEIARATLVGEVRPYAAPPGWTERYLRYQPDAQRLLALGDFAFACLDPRRIQVIGGFAQAGWVEGSALAALPRFAPDQDARLRQRLAPELPADWALLGIDAFGADLEFRGLRERLAFAAGPVPPEAAAEAFARAFRDRPAAPGGRDPDREG